MAVTKNKISDNLRRIEDNISVACAKSGRSEKSVKIIAVTKSVDVDTIRNCIEAGLRDFGENRVQMLQPRHDEIEKWIERKRLPFAGDVRWHMIGHLQRNKVKYILNWTGLIHSVDSLRLAEEIDHKAAREGLIAEILLQVNCSEEEQKFGCAVGAAAHLAETFTQMKNIRLMGLMTMAAYSDDPEKARPTFARLREIYDDIRREGAVGSDFRHLSMGMSCDYRAAVEEGATMVRIGSAIFE